jgi:hypothetical protein
MPTTHTHLHVDCTIYEETQLTDEEIIERERRRRMFAFHWSGGMLKSRLQHSPKVTPIPFRTSRRFTQAAARMQSCQHAILFVRHLP